MRSAITMYPSLQFPSTLRNKLASNNGYYAVESEQCAKTTYVERDGEFAIVHGKTAVVLKEEIWEELCDVLLDLRDRKRAMLTSKGVK